jgi:mRNA interferase MazF
MNKAKLPTHVALAAKKYGIVKDSVVLLEQIRTIDKTRLREKVCHLDEAILKQIDVALDVSLALHT